MLCQDMTLQVMGAPEPASIVAAFPLASQNNVAYRDQTHTLAWATASRNQLVHTLRQSIHLQKRWLCPATAWEPPE
jgi:hypothetical protein